VQAVQEAIRLHNTTLIIFADWYASEMFNSSSGTAQPIFHDDGTRSYWSPVVGGANVPALNALVAPFGLFFGSRPYSTVLPWGAADPWDEGALGNMRTQRKVEDRPNGGKLRSGGEGRGQENEGDAVPPYPFFDGVGVYSLPGTVGVHGPTRVWGSNMFEHSTFSQSRGQQITHIPALVLTQPYLQPHTGRVAVFGDSACIDDNYILASTAGGRKMGLTYCTHMLLAMLEYAGGTSLHDVYVPHVTPMGMDAWSAASAEVADEGPLPVTAQEAVHTALAQQPPRRQSPAQGWPQSGKSEGTIDDAPKEVSSVEPELDAELFLHRKPGTISDGRVHNMNNDNDNGMRELETSDVSTALNGLVSKLKAITSRLAFGLTKPVFQHQDHVHDVSTRSSSPYGRMIANHDGVSAEVLGGPDTLSSLSRTCNVIQDTTSTYRYCQTP
jgi:hypothetical protein